MTHVLDDARGRIKQPTDNERLLIALRARGATGIHSHEIRKLGISGNPSQRISELEEQGFEISKVREHKGRRPGTRYTLVGSSAGTQERAFSGCSDSGFPAAGDSVGGADCSPAPSVASSEAAPQRPRPRPRGVPGEPGDASLDNTLAGAGSYDAEGSTPAATGALDRPAGRYSPADGAGSLTANPGEKRTAGVGRDEKEGAEIEPSPSGDSSHPGDPGAPEADSGGASVAPPQPPESAQLEVGDERPVPSMFDCDVNWTEAA